MAKLVRIIPILKKTPDTTDLTDNLDIAGGSMSIGSYSWYNQLMQSVHKRQLRYNDYEIMDDDVDISKALDIMADEMVGAVAADVQSQIEISIKDEEMPTKVLDILNMALEHWTEASGIENKLFHIARNMLKYGDCFFHRADPNSKWMHIHPRLVLSAIVDVNDGTTPIGWNIRTDAKNINNNATNSQLQATYANASASNMNVAIVPAGDIVRFSSNDDMSVTAPFGESVLKPVVKAFRQKELLEDSVIIYRVQRAPERRVFYIDIGKTPLHRSQRVLEQVKTEVKQQKIPRPSGSFSQDSGSMDVSYDSVYDPMCLDLSTGIPLLDGRTLPLSDIIAEYKDGKQNWAYSINPENGKVVPGPITWAGITRENAEVLKITLDNGESFICTPDHKIPVQGKGYIEAQDLTPDDSLFPFAVREDHSVYDASTEVWTTVYKAAEELANDNDTSVIELFEQSYLDAMSASSNATVDNVPTVLHARVISKETVSNRTTGTISIDSERTYHGFHNFAISAGIYVKNSSNSDYFFPVRDGSRGSRVETLPGGASTGEVDDLEYFRRRMWRGLKIPYSYIEDGSDPSGAVISDGKTGVAYKQEQNFNLMIQRYQIQLNRVLDAEFKRYLTYNGIHLDTDQFLIKLPVPQNFAAFRQQQMDNDLLMNYNQIQDVGHMSKRVGMRRYLQWTAQDILENERDLREELGLDPDDTSIPSALLYNEDFRRQIIEQHLARFNAVPEELEISDEEDGDMFSGGMGDPGMGGLGDFGGGMGGGLDDFGPPDSMDDFGGSDDSGGDFGGPSDELP